MQPFCEVKKFFLFYTLYEYILLSGHIELEG
jgi:hypothetical protein